MEKRWLLTGNVSHLPGRNADAGGAAPEQELQIIVRYLSRAGRSAGAGSEHGPLGRALVFRPWSVRSLHVVGESQLATEFRRLITTGAVSGWALHPVSARRTPLRVLAGPLHSLSGSNRFYNLLEREGFAYVEEVAATPEGCLLELRNAGPRFIATLRRVIADLESAGDRAGTDRLPGRKTCLTDGGLVLWLDRRPGRGRDGHARHDVR